MDYKGACVHGCIACVYTFFLSCDAAAKRTARCKYGARAQTKFHPCLLVSYMVLVGGTGGELRPRVPAKPVHQNRTSNDRVAVSIPFNEEE